MIWAAFASQWIVTTFDPDQAFDIHALQSTFSLHREAWNLERWWAVFTFGFLHVNALHLAVNALVIYFAGREIEPIVGAAQTAGIFVLGNTLGGIGQWLVLPGTHLVGVTAGAGALLATYSTVMPQIDLDGRVSAFLHLKLRAKFVGVIFLLLCLGAWAAQIRPECGFAAGAFGGVVGWIYGRMLGFGSPFWFQRMVRERRRREARLARMPAHQYVAEEIDPILEKIAQQGVGSLTRAERRILERGKTKFEEQSSTR